MAAHAAVAAEETSMFGALDANGLPREPHTLPEAQVNWENARWTQARIRRIEEAWAMHASRATGFGAAAFDAELGG
jgi:hypothetical protein